MGQLDLAQRAGDRPMTSKKFYDDKDSTILRGSCIQKEKGAAANVGYIGSSPCCMKDCAEIKRSGQRQLAAHQVHREGVARQVLPADDLAGDQGFDPALDKALERPGAVDGVVAFVDDKGPGGVGDG